MSDSFVSVPLLLPLLLDLRPEVGESPLSPLSPDIIDDASPLFSEHVGDFRNETNLELTLYIIDLKYFDALCLYILCSG